MGLGIAVYRVLLMNATLLVIHYTVLSTELCLTVRRPSSAGGADGVLLVLLGFSYCN